MPVTTSKTLIRLSYGRTAPTLGWAARRLDMIPRKTTRTYNRTKDGITSGPAPGRSAPPM